MPGFKPGFASCFAIRTRCTPLCSALALRRGIHPRLGRQTANNGTSWRLICASRARSRTNVRLGRASRACSPPICTILRRLIKLVFALSRLMSLAYQKGKLRSIRRKIFAKILARYFVVLTKTASRFTFHAVSINADYGALLFRGGCAQPFGSYRAQRVDKVDKAAL